MSALGIGQNTNQAERINALEADVARLREALAEAETYFDERAAHPQFSPLDSPLEARLLTTIREALNGGPCP